MNFAPHPPTEIESIVSQEWDKHLPIWRECTDDLGVKQDVNPELVEKFRNLIKSSPSQLSAVDLAPEEINLMTMGRNVSQKKGKWWRLPRDLEANDKTNQ